MEKTQTKHLERSLQMKTSPVLRQIPILYIPTPVTQTRDPDIKQAQQQIQLMELLLQPWNDAVAGCSNHCKLTVTILIAKLQFLSHFQSFHNPWELMQCPTRERAFTRRKAQFHRHRDFKVNGSLRCLCVHPCRPKKGTQAVWRNSFLGIHQAAGRAFHSGKMESKGLW